MSFAGRGLIHKRLASFDNNCILSAINANLPTADFCGIGSRFLCAHVPITRNASILSSGFRIFVFTVNKWYYMYYRKRPTHHNLQLWDDIGSQLHSDPGANSFFIAVPEKRLYFISTIAKAATNVEKRNPYFYSGWARQLLTLFKRSLYIRLDEI